MIVCLAAKYTGIQGLNLFHAKAGKHTDMMTTCILEIPSVFSAAVTFFKK